MKSQYNVGISHLLYSLVQLCALAYYQRAINTDPGFVRSAGYARLTSSNRLKIRGKAYMHFSSSSVRATHIPDPRRPAV